MSILRSKRGAINLRDIFGLMPGHAEKVVRYYQAVMRGPSPLTPAERELIYSYCSALAGCHYAHTSHKACAIALGIKPQVFAALSKGSRALPVGRKVAALLKFARKLTLHPAKMRAADVEPLYAAGWPEQAIVDTIIVTALTAWINRILNGFCAYAPDTRHRANGRRLAREGYIPVALAVRRQIAEAKRQGPKGGRRQQRGAARRIVQPAGSPTSPGK
jgi:uncharacterized peroxidase-related enzyme